MALIYRRAGLVLRRNAAGSDPLVQALQADLRKLGYLRAGIDGQFGEGSERAVRALQYDLLNAIAHGRDGDAPVSVKAYNRGRVTGITGVCDQGLVACIEEMLADHRMPTLPRSDDPGRDNRAAFTALQTLVGLSVPRPYLLAILLQESDGQHFRTPTPNNADDFIVVGLDRNDESHPDRITSRGYGLGQYTLFHHPPRADEVANLMLDPVRNVQRAVSELNEKFENFVNGPTPGQQADDRLADFGRGPLRRCRFEPTDARFMLDCARCATESRVNIDATTPLHAQTTETLQPTSYHPETSYRNIPDRSKLGCDWPYAVRRYNGSGINSYHYQFQVLQRLTRPPISA
jgi:peptidoglycan hydrolase-like protein with peptidoglycan-binding domain